ncbi:hypothetical protein EDD11_006512 [Mortierella claussenii]|nr:hypothetical protein EDD11_006512 [Mortierella claussenii]
MPLELLDNVFQQLMYISRESLDRLAEERNQARIKINKQSIFRNDRPPKLRLLPPHLENSGWNHSAFVAAESMRQRLHERYPHQYYPCQHLHSYESRSQAFSRASHIRYHEQQALRQHQPFPMDGSYISSPSSGFAPTLQKNADQGSDYDGEEDDEEEDVDGENTFQSQNMETRLSSMLSSLVLNQNGNDTGCQAAYTEQRFGYTVAPSHDLQYADQDETDSTSNYSIDSDDNELGFLNEGSATDTGNTSDSSTTAAVVLSSSSSSSRAETIIQTPFRHPYHDHRSVDLVGSFHSFGCCATDLYIPLFPSRGINRVDNDADEDEMLYELHRDQYFHPTTHTSLRSDLYNCSLVNRQWRVAALQLLWQSVVLDSESCRIEPSDPCYCCRSLGETRNTRTRLETMLDRYFEIYGLNLANCVQTVELDLQILNRSPESNAVHRILKRLSPFTHLRLVWPSRGLCGELANDFARAMDTLHGQIRHIDFSSGFVVSRAWTREMEKMSKLETITLQSLGSMDIIAYDWSKIRHLRMSAVIPISVFSCPSLSGFKHATFYDNLQPDYGSLTVTATGTQSSNGATTLMTQGFNVFEAGTLHNWQVLQSSLHSAIAHDLEPGVTSGQTDLPNGTFATQLMSSDGLAGNVHGFMTAATGWWYWTGLRKIEIQLRHGVLPREWLQDLAAILIQNSSAIEQQRQPAESTPNRLGGCQNTSSQTAAITSGPPLEVLDLDCEVSHPHKDIFADIVRAWGSRFKEFHFTQSAELTDDFFLLCIQKMTQVKKLSLRESRGITGEGIRNSTLSTFNTRLHVTSLTPTSSKILIPWRCDFLELNLDQSRVRKDFLDALQLQCPGVRYNVREK